jgi:RNA recognition motif-containing protein
VKDAVVMIDKNTYASRGFGFVTFELESSVDKVLREGHAIKGKYIECKRKRF